MRPKELDDPGGGVRTKDLTDPARARGKALALLARREYGVEELARRLAAKGVDPALAGEVVGALAEDGLASDRRFAESYARSRLDRGLGPLAIERDPRQALRGAPCRSARPGAPGPLPRIPRFPERARAGGPAGPLTPGGITAEPRTTPETQRHGDDKAGKCRRLRASAVQ